MLVWDFFVVFFPSCRCFGGVLSSWVHGLLATAFVIPVLLQGFYFTPSFFFFFLNGASVLVGGFGCSFNFTAINFCMISCHRTIVIIFEMHLMIWLQIALLLMTPWRHLYPPGLLCWLRSLAHFGLTVPHYFLGICFSWSHLWMSHHVISLVSTLGGSMVLLECGKVGRFPLELLFWHLLILWCTLFSTSPGCLTLFSCFTSFFVPLTLPWLVCNC